MQTPVSPSWFTQFSASRRLAGLVLVALAVAAGQSALIDVRLKPVEEIVQRGEG